MKKLNILTVVLVLFVVSLISVVGFSEDFTCNTWVTGSGSCDPSQGICCQDSCCSNMEGPGTCGATCDFGGDYIPDCSEGSIGAECYCGGSPYTSGYCCSSSWQSDDCNAGEYNCGNGVCDSAEDYNSCPQDCGGTESRSCTERGGTCCTGGMYCDTSTSGYMDGQANDCSICCVGGTCRSDSTGSCGDYNTQSSCQAASCRWCPDENDCFGTDHACSGGYLPGDCYSNSDCSGFCPTEYSTFGSERCLNDRCVCCEYDSDCQSGYQCNNGYCESTGGYQYECNYNNYCDSGETSYNCPSDCGGSDPCPYDDCPDVCCGNNAGWCGDGTCDSYESDWSCPMDCGGSQCTTGCCAESDPWQYCGGGNNWCDFGTGECKQGYDTGPGTGSTYCSSDSECRDAYLWCDYGWAVIIDEPVCNNGICACCGSDSDCRSDHFCDSMGYCTKEGITSGGWCGDGTCDSYESEWSCSMDCGGDKGWECGDNKCDTFLGESEWNCHDDCGGKNPWCGDGICDDFETDDRSKSDTMTVCLPDCSDDWDRKKSDVPEGCRLEYDHKGNEYVECADKMHCPSEEEVDAKKKKCDDLGKKHDLWFDRGCTFVECRGEMRYGDCLSPDEMDKEFKRCEKEGGFADVIHPESGGMGGMGGMWGSSPKEEYIEEACPFVKCDFSGQFKSLCPEYSDPTIARNIKKQCTEEVSVSIDLQGCPITVCGDAESITELPATAYDACDGNLKIEKDDDGEIVHVKCIMKGDSKRATFTSDEIKNLGDISIADLLEAALKLESIKVKFTQLGDKVQAIMDFYEGRDENEYIRFKLVKEKLDGAADGFEEVRVLIREKAEGEIEPEDVLEVKKKIKNLKEKTIRDILFALLSSAEDVKSENNIATTEDEAEALEEVTADDVEDIGEDGFSFMLNLKECTPVAFHPPSSGEGDQPPTVVIKGKKIIGDEEICLVEMFMDLDNMQYDPTGQRGPSSKADLVRYMNMMAEEKGLDFDGEKISMMCEFDDEGKDGLMSGGPEDGPPDEVFEQYCSGLMLEMMMQGPGGPGPGGPEYHSECGDGICDRDEVDSCPNDCAVQ